MSGAIVIGIEPGENNVRLRLAVVREPDRILTANRCSIAKESMKDPLGT
jgi:hypothetical protein